MKRRNMMRTESEFSVLEILGLIAAGLLIIVVLVLANTLFPVPDTEQKVCGKYGNAEHYCYTVVNKPY